LIKVEFYPFFYYVKTTSINIVLEIFLKLCINIDIVGYTLMNGKTKLNEIGVIEGDTNDR